MFILLCFANCVLLLSVIMLIVLKLITQKDAFSVFNTSLFNHNPDRGIQASLHYQDHPVVAAVYDYTALDVGTKTTMKVTIEEVRATGM